MPNFMAFSGLFPLDNLNRISYFTVVIHIWMPSVSYVFCNEVRIAGLLLPPKETVSDRKCKPIAEVEEWKVISSM
jgi:hypothetical protein